MSETSFRDIQREGKERKCPECGGEVEYVKGELICKKCGLVVE